MDLINRKIFKLKGKVQPYAWGGYEFIPKLLGVPPSEKPAAEYWLGAHDMAPAEVVDEQQPILLNNLIANNVSVTIIESI